MLTLFLEREPQPTHTPGVLMTPSGRELYTLERPWRNNRPFESCIPDGAYLIEPYQSPKFGAVYILSGGTVAKFPDGKHQRSGILIHPANRIEHLAGCISCGLDITSAGFLSNSRLGCKLLFDDLNGNPAMLFISGVNDYD